MHQLKLERIEGERFLRQNQQAAFQQQMALTQMRALAARAGLDEGRLVNMLVEALQNARRNRVRLILAGITPRVFAIFQIARLHTVFEIRDTLEAATGD